jgi:hypothetical protein
VVRRALDDVPAHAPAPHYTDVIGDLLARGKAAGLELPMLQLAYAHLKAYEARRERER